MWTIGNVPFTVIGENVHTSRVVLRGGRHTATGPDGCEAIRFVDVTGTDRLLPIPEGLHADQAYAGGRVKLVKAAILAGMSGGSDAEAGLAFVRALAMRQEAAGADYLDLNVDEVATDPDRQRAAMRWLVAAIEPVVGIPLALDSSSSSVIEAGLAAIAGDRARTLLNSASIERLDVLDLAAAHGCPVVASASGVAGLPATSGERVENSARIVGEAAGRGIGPERIHLDALVLPVGVDPEAGFAYLDAVRAIRAAHGPALHITGGFSNVSFGLPARRLVNEAFIAMATEAGADSGIIDPLACDPGRIGEPPVADDRLLAVDLLSGRDAYGMEFLTAFRAGRLGAPA